MQDRYVGDVGDFGKFGLLRALCGGSHHSPLKLGVFWYRVPDESHNEDGKHTRYLKNSPRFRNCDPELYDGLRQLLIDDRGGVISNRRHLATIEGSGLLPPGTLFFNEPLQYQAGVLSRDRTAMRSEWLARALRATANADVVFVDPDNGIECQSVTRTASAGPKYIFWDEIGAFTARGQTVIIYHHLNRTLSSADQVELLRRQFEDRMPPGFTVMDLVFTRGTRRTYFIASAARHRDTLNQRLSNMLTTAWANHFIRIV